MTEIVHVNPDFLYDHIGLLRHAVARYEPRDDILYPIVACGHDLYAGGDINWCAGAGVPNIDDHHHGGHDLPGCPICFAEPT